MENKNNQHYCNQKHFRRGASSSHLFNPRDILDEIELETGNIFLDLGCGRGDYALEASKYVGNTGRVYAADIQEWTIEDLKQTVTESGLRNIEPITANIIEPLPFEDNSIDVCIIVTVLHTLDIVNDSPKLFTELRRILKTTGRLITIDCKKETSPFGPPVKRRISSKELIEISEKYNFKCTGLRDLGHFYMCQFSLEK